MTKQTPIQTAKRWASEHPDASGCIAVQYLVPKGRGGRRGMGLRRDHYLVDGGKVAKLTSRRIPAPNGGRMRIFNGYCHRCGAIFLQPVLRCCYIPNSQAGRPAQDDPLCGRDRVYARLGMAVLCPSCADGNPDVIGWDDGRLILSEPGQVIIWLGGGTSECTREPLVVLALEK